jgi:hypothetical protein
MGLFDIFKKKNTEETTSNSSTPSNSETPKSEIFLSISKYNEYIVCFIRMQQQGNYAPISAYENPNGEVIGFLYVEEVASYSLTADEVIKRMEYSFEKKLAANEIKSYVILYHSQFSNDNNHLLANYENELKAITISFNFVNGQKGKIGLPYKLEEGKITYQGFSNFSAEENDIIFTTQLKTGKDYFQDREEITVPIIETEIGLKPLVILTKRANLTKRLWNETIQKIILKFLMSLGNQMLLKKVWKNCMTYYMNWKAQAEQKMTAWYFLTYTVC